MKAIAPAKSISRRSPAIRLLLAGLAGVLLAGCAVQPNGRGGLQLGVDSAEIFGSTVGSFPLQNGQQAVLRHDPATNAFSVKLGGTFRVLPLPRVLTAQVAFSAPVGPRTVAVIETQEKNCPYKYVVLAIQGSDILQWNVGNCRDRASISLADGGQAVLVDLPSARTVQRYVYADQRLLRGEVALAPPAPAAPPTVPTAPTAPAPVQPETSAQRETVPGTAGARVIPQAPRRSDTPTVRTAETRPARQAQRTQHAQLPPSMTMPSDEIKPVRIDLRKK